MKLKNNMQINRETAMRLWNKAFGRATKATDFAGREMDKSSYDDRNSQYGWNVDHIFPQSMGGKTNDSNLKCCHILTNDEKADSFPCFNANGKKFEIVKVQNHYEIRSKTSTNEHGIFIDFYDSAAGVGYFKDLKGIQNQRVFVGAVSIRLLPKSDDVSFAALIDFVSKIFEDKNIRYEKDKGLFLICISDCNMPNVEDTIDCLDKCVLLNTYLSEYFMSDIIEGYRIFFGLESQDKKLDSLTSIRFFDLPKDMAVINHGDCGLYINELVKNNSKAKERLKDKSALATDTLGQLVYEYNYVLKQLSKDLQKAKK